MNLSSAGTPGTLMNAVRLCPACLYEELDYTIEVEFALIIGVRTDATLDVSLEFVVVRS